MGTDVDQPRNLAKSVIWWVDRVRRRAGPRFLLPEEVDALKGSTRQVGACGYPEGALGRAFSPTSPGWRGESPAMTEAASAQPPSRVALNASSQP